MSDWEDIFVREVYFILLALTLAFGLLQTTGTVLETDRPVVSVLSCSMYPEYDRGDMLGVRGVDFDSIEEDDVIVFSAPATAAVNIDGESYELSNDPVNTSIGEGRVMSSEGSSSVLEINGARVNVEEGKSYNFDGRNVEVESLSGLDVPIVHRVIEVREDSVSTQGDNNPGQLDFEKDIKPDQVHGKVFFRVPRVGAAKLALMSVLGFENDGYRSCGVQP